MTFNFLTKHGISTKANKESLIAVYFSDNIYQKIHFYEFPLIKEQKYKFGAVTKYDIPQYIRGIPDDFPPICTLKEAAIIKKNKIKEKRTKHKTETKTKSKEKLPEIDSKVNFDNITDEPIPNEMHKYCHLCKKHFDNYIRHINSKIHKDNTAKSSEQFKSIKNTFLRINSFWNKTTDKNEDINYKINNNKENINENIIQEEVNEDEKFKLKLFSQFNQNIKEGCKAKKKIIINNSQLSTAQSFPIIPPKKRKKNDNKNLKDKKVPNKTINEFLINGQFVNIKRLDKNNFHFMNNYY